MTERVETHQAGRALQVPEGFTILEAALADDIAYPHGCRSGRCGSCKSHLVSGEVDLLAHSRFALSDEEKAQGLILACRAIPTTDAIVAWLDADDETPSHPPTCELPCDSDSGRYTRHRAYPARMVEAAMQVRRHAGCGLRTFMPSFSLRLERHLHLGKHPVFHVAFDEPTTRRK